MNIMIKIYNSPLLMLNNLLKQLGKIWSWANYTGAKKTTFEASELPM